MPFEFYGAIAKLKTLSLSVAALLTSAALAAPSAVERLSAPEKVMQLTGDFDRPLGIPTRNLTGKRAGVEATDLGSSFLHLSLIHI